MASFTRPELLLRRSEELLALDQPQAALATLSQVFSSKRFRTTPLNVLEPIIVKFVELCVELRRARTVKEGLHLYKNVAQNSSVASVEDVIKQFLALSEARLEGALRDASAADTRDLDDLEETETPESILALAADTRARDRPTRALVTPWLRFHWEAFRTALDILRNNPRLEVLYQAVSGQAFAFCLKHGRKTEFRRLCETLRAHLAASQKHAAQPSRSIDLNDAETLQRHLDARFQQLSTAVDLELWQEAFRTADDIHGLLAASRRPPKPHMMATFYEQLARILGVSHNFLFQGASYSRLYVLTLGRLSAGAGVTGETRRLASRVLLSALAVPLAAPQKYDDAKNTRLATLLGLGAVPTRAELLHDAVHRRHVLAYVAQPLRDLYRLLEEDFHPLRAVTAAEPLLAALADDEETAQYVAPLKDVILTRLFQQLAEAYSSVQLERIVKLATFKSDSTTATDAGYTADPSAEIERRLLLAARNGSVGDVRIDHATGAVKFSPVSTGSTSAASAAPSVLHLLTPNLATLSEALAVVTPVVASAGEVGASGSGAAVAAATAAAALAHYAETADADRAAALAQTHIISRRQKRAEEEEARHEQAEAEARAARAKARAAAEEKRKREEHIQAEMARINKQQEEVQRAQNKQLAASLAATTGVQLDPKEAETYERDELIRLQVTEMERAKQDMAQKLAGVAKRLDHFERACRAEERPLLEEDYAFQRTRDRAATEAAHKQRVTMLRAAHAAGLEAKTRLERILPDFTTFRTDIERSTRAAYEERKAAADAALARAKEERRAAIVAEREAAAAAAAEAAAKAAKAKAEAEAAAAAAAAAAEAKRAAAAAELEKIRAERERQRREDLERIAAQQRREEEAQQRREKGLRHGAPAAAVPSRIPGTQGWIASRGAPGAAPAAAPLAPRGERPRIVNSAKGAAAPAAPPAAAAPTAAAPAAAAPSRPVFTPTPRTAPTPTPAAGGPASRPIILGAGGKIPAWRLKQQAAEAAKKEQQ